MGRLIGVTVKRYYIPGLYEAWRRIYEEDLEKLERLRYIEERTSIVNRARRGSNSLKATIPQVIAEAMNLKPGEPLLWEIKEIDGEKVIVIKRLKE